MNKTFRSLWNATLGAWVAAPEIARTGRNATRGTAAIAQPPATRTGGASGGSLRASAAPLTVAVLTTLGAAWPAAHAQVPWVSATGNVARVPAGTSIVNPVPAAGAAWALGSDRLGVGVLGAGTVTMENGGQVSSGGGMVGWNYGDVGTATVTGKNSSWSIGTEGLWVGLYGAGTLDISAGGQVHSGLHSIVGTVDAAVGTATVTGAGSLWTTAGELHVGYSGKGTLTIEKGGLVSANVVGVGSGSGSGSDGTLNLLGNATEGRGVLETPTLFRGAGTANLNLNGGILRATGDNADFLQGFGAVTLGAEGVVFDTHGHTVGVNTAFGQVAGATIGLIKEGGGALTLKAASTYSGGTTVNAGTLAIGNMAALGTGDVTLNNGAELLATASGTETFGALVTSNGRVSAATGTVFNVSRFVVGTAGVGGTLHIGSSGNAGTVGVSFVGGSTLSFPINLAVDHGTFRYGDNFIGGNLTAYSGGLSVAAGATADLNGLNVRTTYLDGAGRIESQKTGSASLTVGVDSPSASNGSAFSGVIADGSGGVSLVKEGDNTLTLSGANSYSGGTTVNAGTLAIGDMGALGTGHVRLNNGAELLATASGTETFGQLVTSNGRVSAVTGTTFNLAGYSLGGTLHIGSSGNAGTVGLLSTSGGLTSPPFHLAVDHGTFRYGSFAVGYALTNDGGGLSVAAGATADLNGLNVRTTYLDGAGRIESQKAGSASLTVGVDSPSASTGSAFSGVIADGAGGVSLVKEGDNTLTLSGANSYSGGTTVSAGTLALSGVGSLASTGHVALTGSSAKFDLGAANGNRTIGALSGVDGSTVALGANTLTFGGDGTNQTFAGDIGGTGGLVKQGAGTTTLTGDNTYGGTTTISQGTLQVGNGGTTGTLGSGAVTNNASLVFNRSNDLTVANAIDGSGSLTQAGSGTTTLTGTNTYSGGTFLNAGTLAVANDSNLGSINALLTFNGATADSATLQLLSDGQNFTRAMVLNGAGGTIDANDTVNGTISGVISGDGALRLVNKGSSGDEVNRMTLSGANTYDGGTTIAGNAATGGRMQVAATTSGALGTGAVSIGTNAQLEFNGDGVSVGNLLIAVPTSTNILGSNSGVSVANGASAGSAQITLGAPGAYLDISGGATAAASTIVNNGGRVYFHDTTSGGTAQLTNNSGLVFVESAADLSGTTVTNNAGGRLYVNGLTSTGAVGALSGAGDVVLGSRSLSIGGLNTSTMVSGVISDTASAFLPYAGVVTATGGRILKVGSGKLTLSGDNTYTGGTTINGGALAVNGSVMGDVQVNTSGTLAGSGRIGGNVAVNSGGTLSAGNSPGTLTIGGNLTLDSGATSVFELGQSGVVGGKSNDLVSVGGNLTLGGTLQATASSAGWYRLFDYGVGDAKVPPTVTGSFASTNVTGSSGFTAASHQISTTTAGGGTPGQVNLSVLGSGQSDQGWNGSTTTPVGSVVGGNGTWDGFGSNWTNQAGDVAENWRGSVGVFAGAPGTVTVQGPQSFDTLQFATDGYNLVAGTNGALALAPATGTHGTINTDAGISASIAAPIVNGGGTSAGTGLIKVGSGKLTLSGANTYTGGTAINEGTLVAASNSALGTGAAVVNNSEGKGATLQVDAGVTLGNAISLANGGTLDNAGTLTRTDGVVGVGTVHNREGGVIQGASGAGVALTSGTVVNQGRISGGPAGVHFTAGGTVQNTGNPGMKGATAPLIGGAFAGVQIEGGAGDLTNEGGATVVGGLGAAVVMTAGGTVRNDGAGSSIQTGVFAGVSIQGSAGAVTNTHGATISGGLVGVQLLAGGSVTNGAGSSINGGLFSVQGMGASTTLSNAGTLTGAVELDGAFANHVALTSGGVIHGALNIGTHADSTLTLQGVDAVAQRYSGAVTGATSFAGALTVAGGSTGSWTLDRDLTAASTTVVSGGTLQLGDGGTTGSVGSGAITNHGTLAVNRSDDLTLVNAIDGSGKLVKQGANTLGLTGANSYEGGTELKQGRIDLGHAQALGTGTLAMDDGTALGFTVDGLTIGNAIHMTGSNDPVIDTGSFSETISGVISGAGLLSKEGTGSLTLTGDNSYTGTTTIAAGTLQVGDGGTTGTLGSGAVTNNGALIFKRSDALTVTNAIDGSGSVTQAGSGTTTFSGANSYAGATQVDAGTLRAGAVNTFSAASAHTVAAGATLDLAGFSQKVAGVTNAGTVSLKGSTPGTVLTVTGPWVGNGGTLALGTALAADASPTDKLLLSGANAVASGSTKVAITNLAGLGGQTIGKGIEIVGTEGGARIEGGAFSLAAPVAAGAFEYRLNSTAGGAYLSNTLPPAPGPGPSPDPAAPAAATPLYRAEVPLLAALPEQLRQANLAMLGSMHQRMGDDGATRGGSLEQGQRQAWGRILTIDRDIQQGGTVSPSSNGRLTGFQAGTDLWATPNWRAGVYVGRLEGDMKVSGFARGIAGYAAGQNDLKNEYLGGYLTYRTDSGFYADGVLQAGRHRSAVGTAFGGPAGSNKASSLLASVEVGQAFALGAGWSLEPQLQLVHQSLNLQDTGLIGATVQQDAHNGWAVRAGLRVKGEFVTSAGTVQPYARLNVWHTGSGTDRARFIGPAAYADILTATGGTSTEAALGANWQVSPSTGVYGEIGQLWASGGSARTKGGPNASLGVKVRW